MTRKEGLNNLLSVLKKKWAFVGILIFLAFFFFREGEKAQTFVFKSTTHKRPSQPYHKEASRSFDQVKEEIPYRWDEMAFLKEFPGEWRFSYDKNNKVKSLTGGNIPLDTLENSNVLKLGRRLAPFFGVKGEELSNQVLEPSSTSWGKNFKISQEINGIKVYESFLQLYVSLKRQGVIIIDNQLTNVETVNLTKKYTLEEAVSIALDSFSDSQLSFPGGVIIFPQEHSGNLAYEVPLKTPSDDLIVIISAENGEILFQKSVRIH